MRSIVPWLAGRERRNPGRPSRRRRQALGAELLEPRHLLAATAGVSPAAAAFAAAAPWAPADVSGDYRIDDLLAGSKWDTTNLTFSFYAGGGYYGNATSPTPVSDAVKANVRFILSQVIAPLVNLTFTEVTDAPTSYGTLRYLCSPSAGYAFGYYPAGGDTGGDVVLSPANDVAGDFTDNFQLGPGSNGFQTLIHETCHALGLKHPGNYDSAGSPPPGPFLPFDEDNFDNTLMTYNRACGAQPATPMSYDVLALQYLYPANASTRAGDTSYVFTSVDAFTPGGIVAPTATYGRIKQTLWDGSGVDTVDCSALPSDAAGYRLDITPGGWITSTSAFAAVMYDVTAGASTTFSPGTTYTATTYGTRMPLSGTVIENVVASRSSDTIVLNAGANLVSGYTPGVSGGQDVIDRSDQADTLDLSLFDRGEVAQTRSGNDLVLNLGAAGTVTIKDYYAVAAAARIVLRFAPPITATVPQLATSDVAAGPALAKAPPSIRIVFNTPVTNFTLASLRLYWSSSAAGTPTRPMSLRGASIRRVDASGMIYTLTLPKAAVSAKGAYVLVIDGTLSGIRSAIRPTSTMSTPSRVYFRRM